MTRQEIEIIRRKLLSLNYGKKVGGHIYIHLGSLDREFQQEILDIFPSDHFVSPEDLIAKAGLSENLVLSILHYPNFLENGHPSLCCSFLVRGSSDWKRRCWNGTNRPILHRKELFLPNNHTKREVFAELTKKEEQLRLLENPSTIGWSENWNKRLTDAGILIEGHNVIKAENGN